MKNTLILIDDLYLQYGFSGVPEQNLLFLPMLKGNVVNKVLRGIRKIHLSLPAPFKKIWFADWKKTIQNYDTVILADAGNTFNVARYIRRCYPNKRIIVWYRNSVRGTVLPTEKDRATCEIWSFDKEDCSKYGFKYNPQFYERNSKYIEHDETNDAFFVGQNKGRKKILDEMKNSLEAHGYKTKFCIIGGKSDRMNYERVLEEIARTKVIVDCQCDWQEGITLRPLEALFYGKKLITNNVKIKEFDFYSAQNVFVWGNDSEDKLGEFLKKPMVDVSEYRKKYDLRSWVNRFYI